LFCLSSVKFAVFSAAGVVNILDTNFADLHVQLHGDSIGDVNIRGSRGWDVPTNVVA
jgi:hypothetical protein